MNERVKLVMSPSPEKLPVGTIGVIVWGDMSKAEMVRVKWDGFGEIAMYRDEIEVVKGVSHED